jgi:hypothetical protein
MEVDLPKTSSKIDGPLVKQFSIFLPNKVGAMLDVVKLLHTHNTHVVALSIAESTDSAIARIVVSDPEQVEELFKQHNVAHASPRIRRPCLARRRHRLRLVRPSRRRVQASQPGGYLAVRLFFLLLIMSRKVKLNGFAPKGIQGIIPDTLWMPKT